MPRLGHNRYGKAGIRLVTVARDGKRHSLSDLTVDVWLDGDFEAAYTAGNNAAVLPTDTLRGTVYAFARDAPPTVMETFAVRLASHFHATVAAASAAEVHISAQDWRRIGGDHVHAFTHGPPARATVTAHVGLDGTWVEGGVEELVVLKSAGSGFAGFMVDDYTTLAETDDRILATSVTGRWRIRDRARERGEVDWPALADQVRAILLDTFAGHDSRSVQHTLHAMATAVLAACPELARIRLSMPNLHHVLVDLAPYGRDNPNAVFVATDRPYGVIEATVEAEDCGR